MAVYKTPGVYAEEISTLPPSVAEASTAIPAFFGYTEKGSAIARVTTLLEYQQLFGGPSLATFTVTVNPAQAPTVTRGTGTAFLLYYALSHYFLNGGGPCYIVPVGNYTATPAKADFATGLDLLKKEDEPTLLVFTDAAGLAQGYTDLCQQALSQCAALGDRFAIFDVPNGDSKAFRDNIGTSNLAYGAAYHPYLQTSLSYAYQESGVTVITPGVAAAPVVPLAPGATPAVTPPVSATMDSLKSSNTALYNQVKTSLATQYVILPPSAAVAGIYAGVDRSRGVWKAPANVSVSSIIGPVSKITNDDQELLNVDALAGKSINAIRAFTGKGTLVWGARTLAGNDNEWRYVSVRRLFITIEESTRSASGFAVFEPNDATTWLKVKGVIESYLYGLWERGALAGAAPAAAYFVNVGLGKTMTTQDILEGRMIIEIGVAAVRPAEFIILRFSHKLQQA